MSFPIPEFETSYWALIIAWLWNVAYTGYTQADRITEDYVLPVPRATLENWFKARLMVLRVIRVRKHFSECDR